jgi:threonine dehydrogenase-like Zn-dependent dehydrogenase
LPFYDLYYKELALISARVAKSEDYPGSLALVEKGLVGLEPLIGEVMPLEQLPQAIEMLGSENARRMKIIMRHA